MKTGIVDIFCDRQSFEVELLVEVCFKIGTTGNSSGHPSRSKSVERGRIFSGGLGIVAPNRRDFRCG